MNGLRERLAAWRKRQLFRLEELDPNLPNVLRKVFGVAGIRAVGVGASFLFHVALARLLGARDSGTYYLAFTVVAIATVVGRVGLENAVMRFVAASASEGRWGEARAVRRRGFALAGTVSLAATAMLYGLSPWLARSVFDTPDLLPVLRIMAFGVFPATFLILQAHALQGIGRPGTASLIQMLGAPTLNLLLLFPFVWLLGAPGAALGYVVAQGLVLLAGILAWERLAPRAEARRTFSAQRLLASAIPLLLVSSMNLIMNWTDTFMLGIWRDADAVGVYGVVLRTSLLTGFALQAFNSIIAPRFSALYSQGRIDELASLAVNATKAMVAVSTPVLLLFLAIPETILLIFGGEFQVGATALRILTLGQFINVATGSVGYLLMMTGRERLLQHNIMVFAALNFVLNALLIPRFGLVGASIATATSLAGMNLVSAVLVHRSLGIATLPLLGGGKS